MLAGLLWAFSALWAAYVVLTVTPVLVPDLSFVNFTSFSLQFAILGGAVIGGWLFDKYSAPANAGSRLTSTPQGESIAQGNRVVTSWGYVKMDSLDRWEVGQKMLEIVGKELGGGEEKSVLVKRQRKPRLVRTETSTEGEGQTVES